jgi:drug/metabolite transporter (DMT)-like permease
VTTTQHPDHRQVPAYLPVVAVGIVVVLFGLGPPLTKLVTAPPLVGGAMRFLLSTPLLFLLLKAQGGRMSFTLLRTTMWPGLAFGTNLLFVFAAVQEATVSVLSTTVATQPALLLLLAGPIFGERPRLRQVLWTLVGVSGTAMVILSAQSEVRASALGVLWAVLALLTFSAYWVLTRIARSSTNVDPIEWMFSVNIWALIAAILPILVTGSMSDFNEFGGKDWIWILLIAVFTGAMGHVLMSWAHAYVEAARSSLYLLGMHVVAVGVAWPIHGETLTALQMLGGVVVLGAVAMVIRTPSESG